MLGFSCELMWSWDWTALSRDPNISLEDVKNHPDFLWDWHWLATHQFAHLYLEPWKQRMRWIGVAIDGSPALPGVEFLTFANGNAFT